MGENLGHIWQTHYCRQRLSNRCQFFDLWPTLTIPGLQPFLLYPPQVYNCAIDDDDDDDEGFVFLENPLLVYYSDINLHFVCFLQVKCLLIRKAKVSKKKYYKKILWLCAHLCIYVGLDTPQRCIAIFECFTLCQNKLRTPHSSIRTEFVRVRVEAFHFPPVNRFALTHSLLVLKKMADTYISHGWCAWYANQALITQYVFSPSPTFPIIHQHQRIDYNDLISE